MNWKHLLYVIPLCIIAGGIIGFNFGVATIGFLEDMSVDAMTLCFDSLDCYATRNGSLEEVRTYCAAKQIVQANEIRNSYAEGNI